MYLGNVVSGRKIKLVQLADIIINDMNIARNDTVMVYTSLHDINLIDSQPEDLIYLLKMIIGTGGTLLMPGSEENLNNPGHSETHKEIQRSLYQDDLFFELFRQMADTYQSYLTAEPVSAWGRMAKFVTEDHDRSESVFDKNGLFYKLFILKAKIIGIGVPLTGFSFLQTNDNKSDKYSPDKMYKHFEKDELRAYKKRGIPFFWVNAEKIYNKTIFLPKS